MGRFGNVIRAIGGLTIPSTSTDAATPASGESAVWWDATHVYLKVKDSSGVIHQIGVALNSITEDTANQQITTSYSLVSQGTINALGNVITLTDFVLKALGSNQVTLSADDDSNLTANGVPVSMATRGCVEYNTTSTTLAANAYTAVTGWGASSLLGGIDPGVTLSGANFTVNKSGMYAVTGYIALPAPGSATAWRHGVELWMSGVLASYTVDSQEQNNNSYVSFSATRWMNAGDVIYLNALSQVAATLTSARIDISYLGT